MSADNLCEQHPTDQNEFKRLVLGHVTIGRFVSLAGPRTHESALSTERIAELLGASLEPTPAQICAQRIVSGECSRFEVGGSAIPGASFEIRSKI